MGRVVFNHKKGNLQMTQPQDSDSDSGVQVQPAPKISANSSDKQSSQASVATEEKFSKSEVLELIRSETAKAFQSGKDKRFKVLDQLGDTVEVMSTFKQYLDAHGGDVNKASREMALDQMIASGHGNSGTITNREQDTFDEAEAREIAKTHNVDYDDPAVMEWRKGEYPSHKAARLALNKAIAGKSQSTPSPAGAGTTVFDGGGRASADTGEQLDKLYAELSNLNVDPVTNAAKRATVRTKIKELGGQL